jgi:hypothetical protein
MQLLLDKFDNAGIDEKNKNGLTPFSIALNVSMILRNLKCKKIHDGIKNTIKTEFLNFGLN